MQQSLRIDVYLSETCASYYELRENLDRSAAILCVSNEVIYHTINYDDAVNLSIKGSPTIYINGKDAFKCDSSTGIS